MSASLILGCFWVLAATVVAMLPMRRQYVPGVALLIVAPVLIGFIGWQHGWVFAVFGVAALVSLFRKPLRYFWAKARGKQPELPSELPPELRG
ncbi:DUF2484 family protein [Rhodobacteraceae bacterium LMO-12]|nr:DUF2484 family protein [Rhodobacteraceae bacterium LMO-JJ12]